MEELIKDLCLNEKFRKYFKPMSDKEYAEFQTDLYNSSTGNLRFVDCEICKNKGYIQHISEDLSTYLTECECMKKRRCIEVLHKSGLENAVKHCTFDSYIAQSDWQKSIKSTALNYISTGSENWFYIGGQSGCGKTHICTAISNVLINKGKTLKYEIWRNLFHQLQSCQFDSYAYQEKLDSLRDVDVLYIDDFMKSLDKSKVNTELNFAFEIINARYISNKITVISSELLIEQLNTLDNAVAGRIIERAGGFIINVKGPDKNFRLR